MHTFLSVLVTLSAVTPCRALLPGQSAKLHLQSWPKGVDTVRTPVTPDVNPTDAFPLSVKEELSHHSPARLASKALLPAEEKLFSRIARDLSPWNTSGISLQMVEQVYCSYNTQSFRLQVIDQEMYIVGETKQFPYWHTHMKLLLADVWKAYRGRLADVDLVIHFDDWLAPNLDGAHPQCPQQGPIFAPSRKAENWWGVLCPDASYRAPPGWSETRDLIATSAAQHPWETKLPKLIFRGQPTGLREQRLGADHEALQSDPLDVALSNAENYVPFPDQCRHRYLLYMSGNTWSIRLKDMFLCNSTVLAPYDVHEAFWWHLLDPGVHYVHMATLDGESTPERLKHYLKVLEKHQHYSQRVARNGFDLVHSVLTPRNVLEYWFRLMTAYSELQTFSPSLHPDALPLTEGNIHGGPAVERHFEERTCNMCPHVSSEGQKGLYASGWYKSMSLT